MNHDLQRLKSPSTIAAQPRNSEIDLFFSSAKLRTSYIAPRLLVSVRSAAEAIKAVHGGADILDVKEPARGSLGMASVAEIKRISEQHASLDSTIPLSVALGEVADWLPRCDYPALPTGVTFAKLGLQGCAASVSWLQDWLHVRNGFEERTAAALQWVAVAYADTRISAAPRAGEILAAAIETRCVGLLIDTWNKQGGSLLDEISVKELCEIAHECHRAGLFLALAGKLTRAALPVLRQVPADLIAVRSAVCANTDRTSQLDADCVVAFRHELQQTYQNS